MAEIKKYNKYNYLIDAICYWLGYQVNIGRDKFIHEASLRYPIADALTSENIAINQIILEKSHPLFKRKRIDLVVGESKKKNSLKEIYEFKIAKYTSEWGDEHQIVFDDIVRLAYYNMVSETDSYFLMCGSYENFKQYFVGDIAEPEIDDGKVKIHSKNTQINGWNSSGIYKDWFAFSDDMDANTKEIKFEINDEKDWGLKKFKDNYDIRDNIESKEFYNSNEIAIETECIAISSYSADKTHVAGIWKIKAKQ